MGLDTSHDCWHGAYSAFNRWRQEIALAAGLPPLDLMEGFCVVSSGLSPMYFMYQAALKDGLHELPFWKSLPIKWGALKPNRYLFELLHHSDCEGSIPWKSCKPMADELEKLLPKLSGDRGGHIGDINEKTKQFIKGLRAAHKAKERVQFH
jgi:hypothetical protein